MANSVVLAYKKEKEALYFVCRLMYRRILQACIDSVVGEVSSNEHQVFTFTMVQSASEFLYFRFLIFLYFSLLFFSFTSFSSSYMFLALVPSFNVPHACYGILPANWSNYAKQ